MSSLASLPGRSCNMRWWWTCSSGWFYSSPQSGANWQLMFIKIFNMQVSSTVLSILVGVWGLVGLFSDPVQLAKRQVCWVQDCETRRLAGKTRILGCSKEACQLWGRMMLGFSSFWRWWFHLQCECDGSGRSVLAIAVGNRSSRWQNVVSKKGPLWLGMVLQSDFAELPTSNVTTFFREFPSNLKRCHFPGFASTLWCPPRSWASSAGHEQPPLGWHFSGNLLGEASMLSGYPASSFFGRLDLFRWDDALGHYQSTASATTADGSRPMHITNSIQIWAHSTSVTPRTGSTTLKPGTDSPMVLENHVDLKHIKWWLGDN